MSIEKMKQDLAIIQKLSDLVLETVMFPAAGAELLPEGFTLYPIQYIVDGGDAHFYTGIAFSEKFDGILFYHNRSSLMVMRIVCAVLGIP